MIDYQEIERIIAFVHTQFIGQHISWKVLSNEERDSVRKYLVDQQFTDYERAFLVGLLSIVSPEIANNKQALARFVRSPQAKLTEIEQDVLLWLCRSAANDIRVLGARVQQQTATLLSTSDYVNVVRQQFTEAISQRMSNQQIAAMLREATQLWNRDFARIVSYVMHSAYEHGRIQGFRRRRGDIASAKVRFVVQPTACRHCKTLLLDDQGNPKTFDLATVIANGSNIGRKTKDWRVCVPPLHPHCYCSIDFDESQIHTTSKPTGRPKVSVTVGSKHFNV